MEVSVLSPTERYAAAGLFALAVNHSQIHQTRPSSSLPRLDKEVISEAVSVDNSASVPNNKGRWIDDASGLLGPVFRFLEVDGHAWDGLKETAGSSTQVRHHIGAFLKLLSEESEGPSSERDDKELALAKAVDATMSCMGSVSISSEVTGTRHEYEMKCCEDYCNTKKKSSPDVVEHYETTQKTSPELSSEGKSSAGVSEEYLGEGAGISYQKKVTVLYALLSACITDSTQNDRNGSRLRKGYDARYRVSLRLLAAWFGVIWKEMEVMEIMIACDLMDSVKEVSATEEEIKMPESPLAKWKRGGLIGIAAFTGGALLAVTGGLAAPAIAEGLGVLAPTLGHVIPAIGASGFAAAATSTGSVAGSAAIAASFGAAGAGLSGSKMARRTGSIDEFEIKTVGENHNQGRLAVGIMVSGLAFSDEDFVRPWEDHSDNSERFTVVWESENLIGLSSAIEDWLRSQLTVQLMKGGAMMTVLSTLVVALTLPAALITASDLIDSKWAIAVDRSDQAGKLLAEVLLMGLQGNRPVTLIGFSLGARVVFKCLQCLADTGVDSSAGLVERVVLLGAPVSIKVENWVDVRKIVAGRFVNGYSTNDWTLGIVYRTNLFSQGLAGIQPVDIPGIENVDLTEFLEGHSSYLCMTKEILQRLELDSYDPIFRSSHNKDEGGGKLKTL